MEKLNKDCKSSIAETLPGKSQESFRRESLRGKKEEDVLRATLRVRVRGWDFLLQLISMGGVERVHDETGGLCLRRSGKRETKGEYRFEK